MWWYDSSINNIRSKTSILAVRKPNNPKPRRPRVFRLVESSLSLAGFYGFKTVEIEVFDLILLIDESYHLIKPWFCRFSLLYVTDTLATRIELHRTRQQRVFDLFLGSTRSAYHRAGPFVMPEITWVRKSSKFQSLFDLHVLISSSC